MPLKVAIHFRDLGAYSSEGHSRNEAMYNSLNKSQSNFEPQVRWVWYIQEKIDMYKKATRANGGAEPS